MSPALIGSALSRQFFEGFLIEFAQQPAKFLIAKALDELGLTALLYSIIRANSEVLRTVGCWLLVAVVPAMLWLRAPDAFSHPQFWAEDGRVFWQQWRGLGWTSFWTPYAGYLHTLPRTVAALVWPAPYSLHPTLYLVSATILSIWTAITIASTRLPAGLGIALALSLFLVPHDGEVWASVVNVQWIMAAAIPLLASTSTPRRACSRINQIGFLTAVSLTGPFSAMALPLWGVRGVTALRSGDRHGILMSTIAVLCGLLQAALIATAGPQAETPTAPRPLDMMIAFAGRSGLDSMSKMGAVAGMIVFALVLLSPFVKKGRWQRASFLIFAVLILATVFVKFYRMPELMMSRLVGGRYFFLPSVMVMWIAISLIWTRWTTALLGAVAVATLVPVSISQLQRTARIYYPDWHDKSGLIDKEAVQIQFPPGWKLELEARP